MRKCLVIPLGILWRLVVPRVLKAQERPHIVPSMFRSGHVQPAEPMPVAESAGSRVLRIFVCTAS